MSDKIIKHGYQGNPNLKAAGIDFKWGKRQIKEYMKCAEDPIYFIKKYVKIINVDEGLIPFQMWKFQEKMIMNLHNNRFVISKFPRQTGKSTVVIAYFLYMVLFTPDRSIAILANKGRLARELLGRLMLAYEHLPLFLQQGIKTWNKGDIELENGSKIIASTTSSSAVRGGSYNCIFLDEFAHIPKHIADDFFSSVYPTISSGHTTKVFIVSTPFGVNHFYKMWTQAEEGRSAYVTQSVHWSEVPGRDEEWKQLTISNTSEEQFRREFECEFIGSSNTLISGEVLQNMVFLNPIMSNEHLDVYAYPKEKNTYVLVADCAHGVESDYSAFSVVDVSTLPYTLVAKYRHNKIPPMLFPSIIENVAKKYNNAYVLIEVNDIGAQVAGILHNDLEYDNMMFCAMKGRAGQVLGGGFSKATILGVKTTQQVKRVGCANLKTYVENNKLLIQDFDVIAELTAFVGKIDGSFAAEAGNNDDLVMTLVLFSWLSVQPYFREMVAHDFRTTLQKDRQAHSEESLCPFGIIDDGVEENTYRDSGGTTWRMTSDDPPSDEEKNRRMWGLS